VAQLAVEVVAVEHHGIALDGFEGAFHSTRGRRTVAVVVDAVAAELVGIGVHGGVVVVAVARSPRCLTCWPSLAGPVPQLQHIVGLIALIDGARGVHLHREPIPVVDADLQHRAVDTAALGQAGHRVLAHPRAV